MIHRSDEPGQSRGRIPGATFLALAMAVGITIAWHVPHTVGRAPWPWLFVAAGLLIACGVLVVVRRQRAAWWQTMLLLSASMGLFGGGMVILQHRFVAANDLAAFLGDESVLVRVRGVALRAPETRHRTGGALARFDYRPPGTYFPMRVHALISNTGESTPMRGEVVVRVDESVMPFRAGDRIDAIGFLMRPALPRNPGEFDYREYARSLGQAGLLNVANRDVLTVTPAERWSPIATFLDWRDHLRRRAGAWLLADLPESSRSERDSLLASILLGERDEQIDGVYGPFQRVGLAHVLAISGFHMGVLAGFVLLIARAIGGSRRWHGMIVIGFVLLYLLLVETQVAVLRAGVMSMIASLGLVFGRRYKIGGLVSVSAIAILIWRPDQIFNAGFQLTFGVVLGLIHLSPILRRRWFGSPDMEAPTVGAMLLQWIYTALAASVTAWLIAMPIVLHHFGMISPLAVAMSIITLPLAAIILSIGFLKMAMAAALPSVALLLGVPLSLSTNVLLDLVLTADGVGTEIHISHPSTLWTLAALICASWLAAGDAPIHRLIERFRRPFSVAAPSAGPLTATRLVPGSRRIWLIKWCAAVVLVAWLNWPAPLNSALRIDMLAVGDGSCFVIRSGDSTVVFDAGSSTDLNVARRSLIPAMRRLGVRSIDAIIVSHADFDHYSAVVDLVEEFDVAELLVTPQFVAEALADRTGSAAFLLESVKDGRIVVEQVASGATRQSGDATWTWLHPTPDRAYRRGNDASMVIRIECAERRVLLCGDIQREAIEELLVNHDASALRADIAELPHHGSYIEAADQFMRLVRPAVVMQSTGWQRWRRDEWAQALANTDRLVTARDGAARVSIDHSGKIEVARYLEQNVQATTVDGER